MSRSNLIVMDFKGIKLFHVKLRIGINDDLFVNGSLKVGNERAFFAKQKFGNLRVDSEGQARAAHIMNIAQDFAVDVIANGLPG